MISYWHRKQLIFCIAAGNFAPATALYGLSQPDESFKNVLSFLSEPK